MTMVNVSPTGTCSPERPTDKVRRLRLEGDLKGALRIAKGFTRGITYGQHDAMSLAYECIVHPDFYKELGINTQEAIAKGREVLYQLF